LHTGDLPDTTSTDFWLKVGRRIVEGYEDPLPIPFT
jgi:hypothetical protein